MDLSGSDERVSLALGNLPPGKRLTVRICFLLRLEIFDKSWALLLSPALLPAAASAPQPNLHPLSDLLDAPLAP